MLRFRAETSHSRAQLILLPFASGTKEVAPAVWQRKREGDWGAYSGSCCLTTRKEQGEAAGMEPQAQAGQPRRGWARAVRPGTLIAFGAWEWPQGLGGGEDNDPGSTEWPLPTQGRKPNPGMHGLQGRFRGGKQQDAHSRFAFPKAGRWLETPSSPLPPAASRDHRRSGGRTSVLPVLKDQVLQLSQSLQFPQFPVSSVPPVSPVRPVFSTPGL